MALGQHRSTQRKILQGRDDEERLTADIVELARQYGRYGYRKIAALLRRASWLVNDKRVERIWRRFKAVHLKSAAGQRLRTLTAARKASVRALTGNEQVIRGLLRPLGLKVGAVTRVRFEARVRQLIGMDRLLLAIFEPLLQLHKSLRESLADLHRLVLRAVRTDPICRRLMTMPGIGPVTALAYRATIDDPTRFRRSRSVGAYLGLTPDDTVRRSRSGGPHHEGRRRRDANGFVRGGQRHPAPHDPLVEHEGLGNEGCPSPRCSARQGSACSKNGGHPSPNVDRRTGLPLDGRVRPEPQRNGARSMQGAVRASSHDLSLPVPEHAEEL